jgi:hypothetical protein
MEPRSTLSLNALGAWVSGAFIIFTQIMVWMGTGAWPEWRVGDGWAMVGVSEPVVGLGPVQSIFHWIWCWPLVVGVFVFMAVVTAVAEFAKRA